LAETVSGGGGRLTNRDKTLVRAVVRVRTVRQSD